MKHFFKKYWLLLAVILFQVICNVVWLRLDNTPPAWDQASHIGNAIKWNYFLEGKSGLNFIQIVRESWGYPPLMFFLGGVWATIVGVGVDQISFLNTIILILTLVGIYKLAMELTKSKRMAGLSIIIFSLLPVIVDISRNFLLDLLLVALVTWGIWVFIKSNYFLKFKYTLLFALILVLASLTKLNGFIYFVPLIGITLWQMIKQKNVDILINSLIVGCLFVIGTSWWWILDAQNIGQYLTGLAGQGEPLTDPMNLLNWVTWIHYIKLFVLNQASPIVAIALVGILLSKKSGIEKKEKIILGIFLVVNYVIFTVIKNKDFRFTMPMLPVVIIWVTSCWKEKNNKIFLVLMIWMMFTFINNSFGWPIKKDFKISVKTFLFEYVNLVDISDYPVKSPKNNIWPQKEILNDVQKNSRVLTLINLEEINDNNLKLYSILENKNVLWESTGNNNKFEDIEATKNFVNNYDYALVPENSFEPTPFYVVNLEALKQTRDFILNSDEWKKVKEYQILGDKKIFFMERV